MLQPGQNLGPYRILKLLGQGGMASVYKAHHARLDRVVAIKVMHEGFLQDPTFHVRFEREAQLVAKLDHPNIVPIYDFSEYQNQPYLVMKFIEGRTLKAKLGDGPLPWSEVVRIMTPIAAALDYAHGQHVLHRDIKPSNIMLDLAETPYLTDFGLARSTHANDSTISRDMVIGTPYYISPEQALGRGGLDWRADLYSLGVVLYELIAGRVPFQANTPYAIIHDHIYRPLPLPSTINPAISPRVEAILLKALAKDPNERYQSAAAMIAALRANASDAPTTNSLPRVFEDDQPASDTLFPVDDPPVVVYSTSAATPTIEPDPRRTGWLVGGLVALLAVVLVGAFVLMTMRRSNVDQMPTVPSVVLATATALVSSPPPVIPALQLYDVPVKSVSEAHRLLENNPHDLLAHLTLARAQLVAGNLIEARNTLEAGYADADDKLRYILSSAAAAEDDHLPAAALLLYDRAVHEAQREQNRWPDVRAYAGEAMYRIAQVNSVGPLEMRTLTATTAPGPSPLLQIAVARIQVSQSRLNPAENQLRNILVQQDMPEAHLVLGEVYAAQGKHDQAASEWRIARDAPDAPEWAIERATALLGSTV